MPSYKNNATEDEGHMRKEWYFRVLFWNIKIDKND